MGPNERHHGRVLGSRRRPLTPPALTHAFRHGIGKRHGGLRRQQAKSKAFPQVEPHLGGGVTQVADGKILTDPQLEIAAPQTDHHRANQGRRPDDRPVQQALSVMVHSPT